MPKPRLGFVGIGLMGEAMTRRLLDRSYQVSVWNHEPARLDTVVPHGAVAAASRRGRGRERHRVSYKSFSQQTANKGGLRRAK